MDRFAFLTNPHLHLAPAQDNDEFPYEYALLVAGLSSVDSFGGDKSSGMGQCSTQINEIRWNGRTITLGEALSCFGEEDWKTMVHLIREESAQ